MLILHYAPDNASLIVRLMLEELGQPYQTRLVDRSQNAQRSAGYLKLNPMGLIPALETPDGVTFETAAILLWLADQAGQLAPAPGDGDRALFLSWLFATSNGLHVDLRHRFYPEQYANGATPAHLAATQARITAHLDRYEALLGQGHAWFGTESPSLLDLYVAVLLRWIALYPKGQTDWFTLSGWPALQALAKRVEARPAMHAAIRAEGLGPTPLSAPRYATPPEGSAT